ncbi:hypothetical protein B566_EDAN015012 [Ephemera danica]|nr:hypothetical protein B566_EDAN015012 [Ephemera danica]
MDRDNRNKSNGWQWQRILCFTTLAPFAILLLLLGIITLRTMLISRPLIERRLQMSLPVVPGLPNDEKSIFERAERLAGAIRIPTISYSRDNANNKAFLDLHNYLREKFPHVHNSKYVKLDVINTYSLLYSVTGMDNRLMRPYLLAAHLDVVPANPDTWEVDPFAGLIVNKTYIYGRGAIDYKSGLMVMGFNGAQEIAKELHRREVHELDFVIDEGLPILRGIIPGISKNVAGIGVTEKGYVTLELSVTQSPGHSSVPPRQSAIGILAAAITRLEQQQQPYLFGHGPEFAMFQSLLPDMSYDYRAVFANLWLFSSMVRSIMERNPKMNAIARTTTAVTIIAGGEKENVLPSSARAIVNHRIHPSQTVNDVVEHDERVIKDPRVSIKVLSSREPHEVSPSGPVDLPYQLIAATLRQTFPDTLVAPGVLMGNTDTVWYLQHTKQVYRFFPIVVTSEDTARYHGNNERISLQDYQGVIDFYYRLIKNADALVDPLPPPRPSDEL